MVFGSVAFANRRVGDASVGTHCQPFRLGAYGGANFPRKGFLISEVIVEAALGDIGRRDNLIDADAIDIARGEQGAAGMQERAARAETATVRATARGIFHLTI